MWGKIIACLAIALSSFFAVAQEPITPADTIAVNPSVESKNNTIPPNNYDLGNAITALIYQIKETGIDIIEAYSPQNMAMVTQHQAFPDTQKFAGKKYTLFTQAIVVNGEDFETVISFANWLSDQILQKGCIPFVVAQYIQENKCVTPYYAKDVGAYRPVLCSELNTNDPNENNEKAFVVIAYRYCKNHKSAEATNPLKITSEAK